MVTKKKLKTYSIEPITQSFGEIEVKLKRTKELGDRMNSSENLFEELKKIYNPDTVELYESFYVIFLNRANKIVGVHLAGTGSAIGCVVDTKMIVAMALRLQAQAVAFSHNHPSLNMTASEADKKLTETLKKMFDVFEIPVIDHIIYGIDRYFSFADEGLL